MANSVRTLKMEAEDRKHQTKRIYNPSSEDFTVAHAGVSHTIYAGQIQEFQVDIANHIRKHLAEFLLNKRGDWSNYDRDMKKLYEEIDVTI